MISINIRKDETIDHALRRFKYKCQRAGIYKDFKRASYYLKPSEKKKIARRLSRMRQKKSLA